MINIYKSIVAGIVVALGITTVFCISFKKNGNQISQFKTELKYIIALSLVFGVICFIMAYRFLTTNLYNW